MYCSPSLPWHVGVKEGVPCGLICICAAHRCTIVVMAENARRLLQPARCPSHPRRCGSAPLGGSTIPLQRVWLPTYSVRIHGSSASCLCRAKGNADSLTHTHSRRTAPQVFPRSSHSWLAAGNICYGHNCSGLEGLLWLWDKGRMVQYDNKEDHHCKSSLC